MRLVVYFLVAAIALFCSVLDKGDRSMNNYRVDRNDSLIVPCGMNSILYIGDNRNKAISIFKRALIGLDTWCGENHGYGVLFSKWDDKKNDYIVLESKGIE